MPYLEAVLSMPCSLPLYGYTRISRNLNSVRRRPTFTKLLSVSRWKYFMQEIRSRFKKTNFPFKVKHEAYKHHPIKHTVQAGGWNKVQHESTIEQVIKELMWFKSFWTAHFNNLITTQYVHRTYSVNTSLFSILVIFVSTASSALTNEPPHNTHYYFLV